MSKKMILLFSHQFTEQQIEDAKRTFKINEFLSLPDKLQNIWSNVPSDLSDISEYLSEIRFWLHDVTRPDDIILIQGDFGATYYFVNWAFQNKLIPVYSTTKRIHKEINLPDGTVQSIKSFQHQIFRLYQ